MTIFLWSDDAAEKLTGRPPKFPLVERLYFLTAVRYVSRVIPVSRVVNPDELPVVPGVRAGLWADLESDTNPARKNFAANETSLIACSQLTS